MDFLKAEQLTSSKWRILSIPFGGEFKGSKDLQRERFTIDTDVKPDWFDRRPALWQHGQDPALKDEDIGITDDFELDPKSGWWSTFWLDRGARYRAEIEGMLRAGKAYGSSGALSHLVRTDRKTGDILVWPHAEQTLTTVPINFLSRIVAAKAVNDFTSAGIAVERYEALFADPDNETDLGRDLASAGDDPANVALAKARTIAFAEAQLARYRR